MIRENEISKEQELVVDFIQLDERNYGRMLWKVDVILKDRKINDELFKKNWNYLNFNLDHWQLENDDFYYLPVEDRASLIRKTTGDIIQTEQQMGSTVRFLGNALSKKYLFEVFNDLIERIDLQTFEQSKVECDIKRKIRWIKVDENDDLNIYYRVNVHKQMAEHCKTAQSFLTNRFSPEMIAASTDLMLIENALNKLDTVSPLNFEEYHRTTKKIYTYFLPTGLWDDLIGTDGGPLASEIAEIAHDYLYGEKETIRFHN